MVESMPQEVKPYSGFNFALNYRIATVILKQVWWILNAFSN
jgi:hypothetical protein